MQRLTAERCNGIKTGYWSSAKKEDLCQRLGKYEDTGMEPEEIKPVVHAHWTIIEDDWDDDTAKCSSCGEEFVLMNDFEELDVECMKYCPNCGARMDEEVQSDG